MPRSSLSVGPEEVPMCLGPHSLWVLRRCPRAQVLTECGPEEMPMCPGPHSWWVLSRCPRAQALTHCGS